MPWSFALPQGVFTSPLLAVATPIIGGTTTALLVNRKRPENPIPTPSVEETKTSH